MNLAQKPSEIADRNQALASDPKASAWVSANAGTGKTEVLVRRVLRLLLAGSPPEAILCLTYTKTAAAEMQNRLLKELGQWATMKTTELREGLAKVTGEAPDESVLRRARRLFARTLEAKGGLKVHTIHGFCERLLQRFPLEAGVSPHFIVLDESVQAEMKHAAFDAAIARAAERRDAPLGEALGKIVALSSEDNLRKVVGTMLDKRAEMSAMMAHHGAREDWPAREEAALKHLLGVDGERDAELVTAMGGVLTDAAIDRALTALASSAAAKDRDIADALRKALNGAGERRVVELAGAFMTAQDKPKQKPYSKEFADNHPDIAAALTDAQERFARLHEKRAHLRVAEASAALLALAEAVRSDYERRKQAEAALDYDDLIDRAQSLLQGTGAAAWVLYKIDGGIEHILVDEAQDTNPAQWSIVTKLAEEFFAGAGSSDKPRTFFAVGDEKQSIYSFQGAAPAKFGETGHRFSAHANASGQTWRPVQLNVSFRSTAPILDAVDTVFAKGNPAAAGLAAGEEGLSHTPFREGAAGLVEFWDVESDTPAKLAEAFKPWEDEQGGARGVDALCERIGGLIKHWLESRAALPSAGRAIRPGDILILVRRREPFTTPMFRALKRLKVPVAGADRMRLMEQLAVEDLVALAEVLLLPEDDLSLAVVLKSPLFGLNDSDLFRLGHDRRRSLWAQLENKAGEDHRYAEAAAALSAWRSRIDFQPPYEFFSELLERDGQKLRKRFLARLGPEAAEALDEFLDRALAYDREQAPSLQGFTDWLRVSDVEIKRDMDQDRDEVRIMTVHGAKGLQAPIVFLPDTCTNARAQGQRLFPMARSGMAPDEVQHLLWAPGLAHLAFIAASKAALDDAEREENHRLLYVGMTRPKDRLYIAGWQGGKKREDKSWHQLIEDSLKARLDQTDGHDGYPVWRKESKQTAAVERKDTPALAVEAAEPPRWATTPAAEERPRFVSMPSRLGADSPAEAGDLPEQPPLSPRELADNERFARGRLVHTLLQYLPAVTPDEQERAARNFVERRGVGLPEAMLQEIVGETLAIVREARFAPLFAPGSLGEVPVVARLGDGPEAAELSGQIDRLAILGDELLILDYKTNRPSPNAPSEVAEGYIMQLAAYRLALRRMFSGRSIRAALLWTDGPKLMEIPSTMLDAAEARIQSAGRQP